MKLECRRVISPTPLNVRGIFSSFSSFFASAGGMLFVFPFFGVPPWRQFLVGKSA